MKMFLLPLPVSPLLCLTPSPVSSSPAPPPTPQYSQMRDEVFKSNLVCAFIVLIFITTIQSLLPSTR